MTATLPAPVDRFRTWSRGICECEHTARSHGPVLQPTGVLRDDGCFYCPACTRFRPLAEGDRR